MLNIYCDIIKEVNVILSFYLYDQIYNVFIIFLR